MRKLDWNNYCELATQLVAEGNVLVKNENNALPLEKNSEISLFGRIQTHYYKSGTGSGGMVNVPFVYSIADGLEKCGIKLNDKLKQVYSDWEKENPYNPGEGWGGTPWSQKEMVPDEQLVNELAKKNECAVAIIGRTAGEEQDNRAEAGSYYLSSEETSMLKIVRKHFKKLVVVLNVGNIIDMKFMNDIGPDACLYAWQGGMMGGLGTARVLIGEVNPCGCLPDTIARNIDDYPSTKNFGRTENEDIYEEDIYVGYRYFETFNQKSVMYPFGFGLSYTSFDITFDGASGENFLNAAENYKPVSAKELCKDRTAVSAEEMCKDEAAVSAEELCKDRAAVSETEICKDSANIINRNNTMTLSVNVTNTGKTAGKKAVMVYVKAPCGKLGKPERALCGYAKTGLLMSGASEKLDIDISAYLISSYDDAGVTGYKNAYVLEAGDYDFYVGQDVRSAEKLLTVTLDRTVVTEQFKQVLAPEKEFKRLKAVEENGTYGISYENVPVLAYDEGVRIAERLPKAYPVSGDKGIKLADVYYGRASMEAFIAQMSEYELNCIVRGEGMGSPRVTAGTASAFGGVTKELENYGIPAACCSDGPSGMRLDCGSKAFSLPNGATIAASFNTELVTELFELLGLEMSMDNVDCLLGPGMNIQRNPLNGRNFEYFSEDPYLTGTIAAAELNGLHKSGVTGTIKHFCGNNRETNRHFMDSVVSERALREIYLKGFEIAVRLGDADSVMTTYGKVNGIWTAGNYGLVTEILRDEWGFSGMVMTDWWANINDREHREPDKGDFSAMVRAQNDTYMVCANSSEHEDDIADALKDGRVTIGELQRCAFNICSFLLHTNAFKRLIGEDYAVEMVNAPESEEFGLLDVKFYEVDKKISINFEDLDTSRGSTHCFALTVNNMGMYKMKITGSSTGSELAQIPMTVFSMGSPFGTYTWNGTGGKPVSFENELPLFSRYSTFRLYFAQSGLKLHSIDFELMS